MSVLKFTAVLVSDSSSYPVSTVSYATVGQVAEFLGGQENRIVAGTLELARPVEAHQCLQEIDFQAGDRLVVFTRTTQAAGFTPLRPGDKVIRLQIGDTEIRTKGKKNLLIGKSDENQRIFPELDLRGLVTEHSLDYVSRQSVQLMFDEQTQVWVAVKVGQTRVVLDDLDVGSQPVALNANHLMRLYRANDNPAINRPIAEIRLSAETIPAGGDAYSLPGGSYPIRIIVGAEQELRTLRASSTLPLGQIGTSLIQYLNPVLISDMQLYLMRLIPPQTRVSTLKSSEFLYAALRVRPLSQPNE